MKRQEVLDRAAALHQAWLYDHADQVPAVPADSHPHGGGPSDYAEHHADRSAPADVDDLLNTQFAALLAEHRGAEHDTAEADRVVDDAGDVILEAGWVPPVPSALVDLGEADSDRKLRKYWVSGAGAAKINWGVAGDFKRCVAALSRYVKDPEGLCNSYHKAATGVYPGQE